MKKDKKYDEICKKLGFIPSELNENVPAEENDNQKNPFSVLSVDEITYLYKHGYLNKTN